MANMVKRFYAPQGHFVRAALDFLDDGAQTQGFPGDEPGVPKMSWQQEREAMRRMFAQGLASEAYIHFNESWKGDRFHIRFAPPPGSQRSPTVSIKIVSFAELRKRAEFHRKEASIGARIRKPKVGNDRVGDYPL